MNADAGPIHAFLAGRDRDGGGRLLAEVIAFDDARIEGVHDFVQWCFPLEEPSRAVPSAPILARQEAEAIRADPEAQEGLRAALARMRRFYARTDGWLRGHDHNHLRITRILTSVQNLLGHDTAAEFHDFVVRRNDEAGGPINATSLAFWARALD